MTEDIKDIKIKRKRLSPISIVLISLVVLVFSAIVVGGAFVLLYEPDPNKSNFGHYYETNTDGKIILPTDNEGNTITVPPIGDKEQPKGVFNFLILGHDKVAKNTDIIMIVRYNIDENTISIVQIPRDTYVNVSGKKSHKINALYGAYYNSAKKAGSKDPTMEALSQLAGLLQTTFHIRINHAAIIDIDGFVNIIDIIGGVYMNVPADMKYTDKYQNLYIDLKKGEQWLDGEKAMQFVRYRSGYVNADIGRTNALKIFMSALLKQVKENMSISTVSKCATEILSNMKSTVELQDFMYFAKNAFSVDLSKVYMVTLPGKGLMVNGASCYVLCRADVLDVINNHLNVFNEDIKDLEFDPYRILTDETNSKVSNIYTSPLGTVKAEVYVASDVNENSINIPRR